MSEKTQSHFDLHINGCGWLNRAREVKPRKGAPFLSVTVVAIHGDPDDVERLPIDCKVVGEEAKHLVKKYMDEINDRGTKVFVSFRAGDPYIDTFTYEHGEKAGQPGYMLKARLLFISSIRINGEVVYQAPPKPTDADTGHVGEQARAA